MTPPSCGAVADCSRQQFKPPVVDLLGLPGGLGQKERQPLHPRPPRAGDGLRPGQAGDRLVPLPRRQQPGQILTTTPPLSQAEEEIVEPGRALLQRPRHRRTRTTSGHLQPSTEQLTLTTGRRPIRPAVNPQTRRMQRTTGNSASPPASRRRTGPVVGALSGSAKPSRPGWVRRLPGPAPALTSSDVLVKERGDDDKPMVPYGITRRRWRRCRAAGEARHAVGARERVQAMHVDVWRTNGERRATFWVRTSKPSAGDG